MFAMGWGRSGGDGMGVGVEAMGWGRSGGDGMG